MCSSTVRSISRDPQKFSDFCAGIGYSGDSIVRTLVNKFDLSEDEAGRMVQDSIDRMEGKFNGNPEEGSDGSST